MAPGGTDDTQKQPDCSTTQHKPAHGNNFVAPTITHRPDQILPPRQCLLAPRAGQQQQSSALHSCGRSILVCKVCLKTYSTLCAKIGTTPQAWRPGTAAHSHTHTHTHSTLLLPVKGDGVAWGRPNAQGCVAHESKCSQQRPSWTELSCRYLAPGAKYASAPDNEG
jgi:hypothetical protein